MRADNNMGCGTSIGARRGMRRWLAAIALCAILGSGVMAGQAATHSHPATALSSHTLTAVVLASGSNATGGGGPPTP
jgi:hypothetical protein